MSDFSNYLHDVFQDFGQIYCRSMFGGTGVFYDGLMIGLVADDVLYLKADKNSSHLFLNIGQDIIHFQTDFQSQKKSSIPSSLNMPMRFPQSLFPLVLK